MGDYWTAIANTRIGRRRALAATGSALVGSALLAACSSDDNKSSSGAKSNSGGLITAAEDTSKQAKRGGTIKFYHFADPPSFDPTFANLPNEAMKQFVYSWMVQYDPGHLKPTEYNITGDLMESWEFSPDKTQLTFKLRPSVKWHNKAPLNGREMTTDDLVFSWNKLAAIGTNRDAIVNAVNPSAPVLSFTAPDSKTIVVKLKQPLSYILAVLAYTVGGGLTILPKEADSTVDLKKDMVGTGPFYLDKYVPSGSFTFKRFADYFIKDSPYVDQIDVPIVPEYATELAQLKAGNIYTLQQQSGGIRGEDVLPAKKDVPDLVVYQGDYKIDAAHAAFGWLPAGKSPFLDERVRQAWSMSWDRDAYIDAVYNVSKFQSQGLAAQSRWNTCLYAYYEGFWLDPKGKDFGPNAKYFQHDLATAKQLLSAAGYANGVEVQSTYPAGNAYGQDFTTQVQILVGFARDAGFKVVDHAVDYTSDFIPNYRNAKGQHPGVAWKIGPGYAYDAFGRYAYELYSKGGTNFYGFDAAGTGDGSGDPQLDALVEKGQAELDTEKRKQLSYDVQRYMGQKQYLITWPGGATAFDVAWPVLRNFNTFQGTGINKVQQYFQWVDDTKAPLKKA